MVGFSIETMASDRAAPAAAAPRSSRVADRLGEKTATRRNQLTVVCVAALTHGWLVVNNGIYFDDWILYTQLKRGDWASVRGMADQLGGIPAYLYVWAAAAAIPPPMIGYKILSLLLITGTGLLIYSICSESGLVSRTEALLISCLAVAYPSDHTHVLLITVPYLIYWFVFLVATLLLMRSEAAVGWRKLALRLIALVCFLFSFGLNSLLLFYFGVLLLGVLYLRRRNGLTLARLFTEELPRHADLLIAPFAFWFVYRTYFPPNGIYGYYHQFHLGLGSIVVSIRGFWQSGVVAQFHDSIEALALVPLVWLAALFAVQRFWRPGGTDPDPLRPRLAMLGFGVLLGALAVIPYIAVGLAPSDHGWNSRHTILLGVAVGIVLVAGARILFRAGGGSIGLLGTAVLVTLLLGFIVDSAVGYVGWEARWIKDSSVMANLAATPGADRYSVYWIDDRYQVGGEPDHRYYEWSSMLGQAFGGQSRIGLDIHTNSPQFLVDGRKFFNASRNLAGLDPAGCEAGVSISQGPDAHSELGLVARYVFYSLFDPAQRDRLVAKATTVDIQPLAAAQATNCPST